MVFLPLPAFCLWIHPCFFPELCSRVSFTQISVFSAKRFLLPVVILRRRFSVVMRAPCRGHFCVAFSPGKRFVEKIRGNDTDSEGSTIIEGKGKD